MNDRMKKFYMGIAEECAKMSRAVRLQVGCVVVRTDNILSFSWNGTPTGWDNNCEDKVYLTNGGWLDPETIEEQWPYTDENGRYALKTKPEVLHAEMNALMKLAKTNESGNNASIFVTHAPCINCAKGMYQAGIKEVYYKNKYRSTDGIDFLTKSDIKVIKIGD